jgi:hypothetical protein
MISKPFFIFAIVLGVSNMKYAVAQDKPEKELKNSIKYNITTPAIFGFQKTYILGYERVINKHQTLSINIGRTSFPSLSIISTDSLRVTRSRGDKGLHVSAEYRFYLKHENKYNAPRGVYIGPYYSYNYFGRTNSWNMKNADFNGTVDTDLSLRIHTVGVEFGYQFIFWKRLVLDMILIGPGIASYELKAALNTSLSSGDKQQLFQKINDALAHKIPGYSLVLSNNEFKTRGVTSIRSFNYRYLVQLGFRF